MTYYKVVDSQGIVISDWLTIEDAFALVDHFELDSFEFIEKEFEDDL